MLNKIIIILWVFAIVSLFLYSFVQVDLGLTLTRASFFQDIQRSFQYVGYFNRPLSAYLFAGVITTLFVLYTTTLYWVLKNKITGRTIFMITAFASLILIFSYSATSYDIFNYIFDAKIVTGYGENPYVKKALDYPADPMLGFMHWTHRTYPYGPTWLGFTIPLSFLGGGYFLLTYYLFKMLAVGTYIISAFLIYKIARISKLGDPLLAVSFFALNPLVIIETLVSGHNDLSMMMLALFSIYLLLIHKKYSAWFFLLLSAGVKFATIALLPLFVWYPFSRRKNKTLLLFSASLILMVIAVIAASVRTTFQPWYFLFCIPFVSLLSKSVFLKISAGIFSFLILFQYLPFFYTGNYDPPVPYVMNLALFISIGMSLAIGAGFEISYRVKK